MIENMEWYRAFYYTAKTGSLTRAAEELYITQPAVSHSLKQLEAKLGGPLFFRTSKGVKLTSEGEVLFQYIDQAYHFIRTGERKLAEMRQFMAGEITIGAGDTLCKHYLLPYLQTFHESYPGIQIKVANRTTYETIQLLREGKIDFGIVNLPIAEQGLEVRESVQIEDCFVAGAKYEELSKVTQTLEQLLQYPILLLEKGSSTRAYIDRFAEQRGLAMRPEIELGSIDLLMEFARIGLGIACVVKNFAAEELEQGRLYEIQLDTPIPPRRIGIVTLRRMPLSFSANRFLELLPT